MHYINSQGPGCSFVPELWSLPMGFPAGSSVPYSAAIREAVDIPVFTVGQVTDPLHVEKILADGHADMVGISRQAICDPDFVNKAHRGQLDDIRTCIHCNQGCLRDIFHTVHPITCTQNAVVGYERELALHPAEKRKKVMVIGGGPAGMEAARVAANRRHKVVLYEKADKLGGQLNLLVKTPHREEFGNIIRWQSEQLSKLGVTVKLSVEATADTIKAENPDVVILATGSTPLVRPIPGIETANVVTYWDVIEEKVPIGERVLVADLESHHQSIDTATFLAERGKKVQIVTPVFVVGQNMDRLALRDEFRRMIAAGVTWLEHSSVVAISGKTVTILNGFTRETSTIGDFDTIVLSQGNKANDALYHEIKDLVQEVYRVGDCYAPRNTHAAINQSYRVTVKV